MKILFVSLGCDKNLVDTEMMLGMLREKGWEFTDDENEADAAIVNTCCFIGDAKEESIHTLLELGTLKENGRLKVLIAAGCLAQRYQKELLEEIPEVDAIIGTMAIDKAAAALEKALSGKPKSYLEDINRSVYGQKRILTTGGHYAYLKIAEGCSKRCSYCVIPSVRGNYRSVPMETLLKEAKELADGGVKELILVAQETTLYGVDLYGEKSLPLLLHKLAEISGIHWIRILYCYPEEITPQLIQAIKEEPKVCRYLDMPIQHASNAILKKMGRRTTKEGLEKIIAELRKEIPDICIRTTLITGFPGESAEDHEESLAFVRKMKLERLGVFPYSKEEDTPAAKMPGQIRKKVKLQRQAELMELQQDIAFEKAKGQTGRILTVMVEGKLTGEDVYVTRTYMDAPGVDGYLFLHTTAELMTGDFVKVRVTGSNEYDLLGEEMSAEADGKG